MIALHPLLLSSLRNESSSFMKFEIYTMKRPSWVPSNNRLNVHLSVRYKISFFFSFSSSYSSQRPSSSALRERTEKASRISFNFFEFQDAPSLKTTQGKKKRRYVEHASSLTYHATSSRVLLVDDASPCTKNGNIIL